MEAFSARAAELAVSDMIKGIYGEAAGGWFAKVCNEDFHQAVGRYPTSLAKFAFDHHAHVTAR